MVQSTPNAPDFESTPLPQIARGGCGSCGSGAAGKTGSQCGNGLEKIYPTTAVRFGTLKYIGEFTHTPDMRFTCGAKVVIQTRRGIELGEQVSLTCGGCDKSVGRDQMREWVERCGEDSFAFDAGRILREATAGDLAEYSRIQIDCREKRDTAQRVARQRKLPLDITECEHLFGGERIIFFFTANERVDFRGLVKDLATEYRTRIEMRQIGARDEARLLADYETCGREVCCKVFLKTLKPISMRMAKLQKATLDPTQVSGRCGRLKCCLRYEHEGYEDMEKRLPRIGVRVRTNHGEGVIINRQILTQLIQIRTDANKLLTVVMEDVTDVGVPKPPPDASPPRPPERRRSPTRRPGPPDGKTKRPPGTAKSEPAAGAEADPKAGSGETARPDGNADGTETSDQQRQRPRGRRRRRRRKGGPEGRGPEVGGPEGGGSGGPGGNGPSTPPQGNSGPPQGNSGPPQGNSGPPSGS